MRCQKCGQEASGNYCNNCGASLMEEDHLLEENLADSLKDLFEDMDSEESEEEPEEKFEEEPYDRGKHRIDEPVNDRRREPSQRAEKTYTAGKSYAAGKSEEAPLRAPRSRKDPNKEQKKSTREKPEKPVKPDKKKEESDRSRREGKENRDNQYRDREPDRQRPVSCRREVERMYGENGEHPESGESAFQTAKNTAVRGAVGVIITGSRIMQILSALLMAAMVAKMVPVFLSFGRGLGLIDTMLTDRNYGLILYVGMAGFALFMGAVWSLWILSRKAAGGQVRLKKYDIGRGFFPFLICLAAVFGAGIAALWVPAEAESFRGLAGGMTAFLSAVNGQRGFLFSCSVTGAVLSFVRKLLRV